VPIIILVVIETASIDPPAPCIIWRTKKEESGFGNKWRKREEIQ